MIRLSMGYPAPVDEIAMVLNRQGGNPLHTLAPVMTREHLMELQDLVEATHVSEAVVSYIVSLIAETRRHPEIRRGASPRATLAVVAMSKAAARLRGRDYVIPADVKEVFVRTLSHRLLLTAQAESTGRTPADLLGAILAAVPQPKLR